MISTDKIWARANVLFILFVGLTTAFLYLFFSFEGESRPRKKIKRTVKSRFKPVGIPLENSESPEFSGFIEKLKDLKNGKKRNPEILIIGDSHMQCEDFGSALMQYFKDSLNVPVAGRGFVFPYPLARTSHRSSMEFKPTSSWTGCRFTKESNRCDWGLSGWIANCHQDSVDFVWKMNQGNFKKGDQVVLFSPERTASDFEVILYDSLNDMYAMPYRKANSGYTVELTKESRELKFHIVNKRRAGPFTLQGLYLKPAIPGLVVGISGTNGARLDHYLQSPDFQKHLAVVKPSMVLISLGTNDAFSRNFNSENTELVLQQLLTRIKTALPEVSVLLCGPPDHCYRKGKVNPKTEQVGEVFSQIAQRLDFTFWNQQKAMGGKGSIFSWRSKGLATKDMVHFTTNGYVFQARLLGRSFGQAMKEPKPPSGRQEP